MPLSPYYFESFPDGSFGFYSGLNLLFKFNRLTFRDSFEAYASGHGLSSNWIGSMLRLFNKACPAPVSSSPVRTDLERLIYKIGVHGIVEHLQDRGFRVTRPLNVSEIDLIRYLEKEGYEIEGFIGDVHYSSVCVVENDRRKINA